MLIRPIYVYNYINLRIDKHGYKSSSRGTCTVLKIQSNWNLRPQNFFRNNYIYYLRANASQRYKTIEPSEPTGRQFPKYPD